MKKILLKPIRLAACLALGLSAASCGVPRAALDQARLEAQQLQTLPANDAGVRQALVDEAPVWQRFSTLVHQQEFGGIWQVDPEFIALADRTAAIAARQAALIAAGQDDAALNRAMLQEFQSRWQQNSQYLGQ